MNKKIRTSLLLCLLLAALIITSVILTRSGRDQTASSVEAQTASSIETQTTNSEEAQTTNSEEEQTASSPQEQQKPETTETVPPGTSESLDTASISENAPSDPPESEGSEDNVLPDDKANTDWQEIDDTLPAISTSEHLQTGWVKYESEWYYYKENGTLAKNEWIHDGRGWCWLLATGEMASDRWLQYNGARYYLKDNGYMAESMWVKNNGAWRWVEADGKMRESNWAQYVNSDLSRSSAGQVRQDPDILNILLTGIDKPTKVSRTQRSDAMIIVTINKKTNQIRFTSLMRDMFVPVQGHSDCKLNTAYEYGGLELLNKTLEDAFAVHIDGNLSVDFENFISAMDNLGGLEIELKDYEHAYLKEHYPKWDLQVGSNILNSRQLLAYCRMRKGVGGDYERTDRHRIVLTTAFDTLVESDLPTLLGKAETILPYITTNMSKTDLLDLVHAFKQNDMRIAASNRLPVEGTESEMMVNEQFILLPDLTTNQAVLKEYIYG